MTPGIQKQNLLLSATLNEKVNHLAKISLENPVMIGLDNKKIQSVNKHVSFEPDGGKHEPRKLLSSSTEDYKLPAHLVQKYIKGDSRSFDHIDMN